MATDFKLPELGENIETIKVTKVMVAPGAHVAVDQPVLELETDKATIEVPCPVAGAVTTIHVKAGDEIKVGALILTLEGGPAAAGGKPAAAPQAAKPAGADTPPPPRVEPPAPAPAAPRAPAEGQPLVFPASVTVAAAPSVRRFAREIGIDLSAVKGSGPGGRVSIDDVKRHARAMNTQPGAAAAPRPGAPKLPDFAKWGPVETENMSAIRRKTAEHMALSWAQIPHVTIHDRADITALEPLRRKYAERAEALGGKLTMAVMVCKVVAAALRQHPKFNAAIDMTARQVIYKKYVHLGVAVSTERGLVVPVIRDADGKNMIQMAAEIAKIAQKARTGKIELSDLEGGTFTVTNLGRVGGSYFTPIINYPEVAILGMGRTTVEAAAGGKSGERTYLPLSLSFDHRLIDGAEAAQFMGWIIEAIEEPLVLALQG
jgi:pyruvate dehydrogenase E2 component (dihydrolipoamide acetyltransferase)